MRKAVMYGAGNIGRGFVGALMARSGYAVTFVDVAEEVVSQLRRTHRYTVRIVRADGFEDIGIEGVDAVDGRDADAVAQAIAEADLAATAVGVNVLDRIAPNLAAGIARRRELGKGPLDILICENRLDADHYLRERIRPHLPPEARAYFEDGIGLVETSIGRMVPVQTDAMKDGDPLRVCVEEYGFLPVDKDAFRNGIPPVEGLVPHAPFAFYLRRKLFLHNMGHAVCAYLGAYSGHAFVADAISDPEIRIVVENAMLESAEALSRAFGEDLPGLLRHVRDLVHRFSNPALRDTCARVGADPHRKLGPHDRLVGASRNCLEQGVDPVYLGVGTAAAVFGLLSATGREQTVENAREALRETAGLPSDDALLPIVLPLYAMFASGEPVSAIRRKADEERARRMGPTI